VVACDASRQYAAERENLKLFAKLAKGSTWQVSK
jgi:hypothetical protein